MLTGSRKGRGLLETTMSRRIRTVKRTRRLSRFRRSARPRRQFIGLEPLERRLLLSATIALELDGAAATSWAPGYEDHNVAASQWGDDGGVALGEGWWPGLADASSPTYSFYLPNPQFAPGSIELTQIDVRLYGEAYWADATHLIIGGIDTGQVEEPLGYTTKSYSGSTARSLLQDVGDGVAYRLDVGLEQSDILNFLDWYDLRDVTVEYSYSGGLNAEWLSAFHEEIWSNPVDE